MTDVSEELARRVTFRVLVVVCGIVALPALSNPALTRWPGWLGPFSGALLFTALARRRPPAKALIRERLGTLATRSAYLALAAGAEEVVWRGFILRALAQGAGVWVALALTTGGFAAWHAPRLGARSTLHLVTGGTFGCVALVTASVAAAAAAHALYNVLVGLAAAASTATPRRAAEAIDTGRG